MSILDEEGRNKLLKLLHDNLSLVSPLQKLAGFQNVQAPELLVILCVLADVN